MGQEFFDRERRHRQSRGLQLVRQGAGKIRAGLQQIDHDQAKQQRDERRADEPAHGLREDPPQLGAASHMGDAADQGREHQRRDDHLDQAQEQHRDQVYICCDFHPAVGKIVENQRPHHDAKRHRDQNILRKPVRHFAYPRKARRPRVWQNLRATQHALQNRPRATSPICPPLNACHNVPVVQRAPSY